MAKVVEAIYEDDVIKPLEKIKIKKGTKIKVILITRKKKDEKKFLEILKKLPKINDFKWKKIKEEYYEERMHS